MVRFYGSLDFDTIKQMPCDEFDIYWQSIEIIEAQEQLMQMNISDYPHIKQTSREKLHRSIHDIAFPKDQKKALTTDDVAKALGRSLNG